MWFLFAQLFDFIKGLLQYFFKTALSIGYKYPILLSYIGVVSVLSVAFYESIEVILVGVSFYFPQQYLGLVQAFIPSNWQACFSVVLSVRFIILSLNWAFKFREKFWEMANDASNMK